MGAMFSVNSRKGFTIGLKHRGDFDRPFLLKFAIKPLFKLIILEQQEKESTNFLKRNKFWSFLAHFGKKISLAYFKLLTLTHFI